MATSEAQGCACSENANDPAFLELDSYIESIKDQQGNLILILQKAQAIYGYLSKETVQHISKRTGHTQAKIFGVATFYTQFRLSPIGKNLIMLCQGTACHVSGSARIGKAISEELEIEDGETTKDGLFTLNNVACLGCCSLAPVMMISNEDGEETYGKLTEKMAIDIIRNIKSSYEEKVV
jgi:NADH-quinone oxidoreductase subunit E